LSQETIKTVTLGHRGHGDIGPKACGIEPGVMDKLRACIYDDSSYREVSPLAPGCVDGRRDRNGACLAGGILTVVVGHMAVHGVKPGETVVDILHELQDLEYEIILHEGCGALQKFMIVMGLMADGDEDAYSLMQDLGISVSADMRGALSSVARAVPLGFMPSEQKLFEAVREMGGTVERFSMKHHVEGCACVNTRPGTSIRRELLDGHAFVLDAWVIDDAAGRLAKSAQHQAVAKAAMTFYNCDVLEQLCDEDLEIDIHE
jgi:hypothetical protein